MYLEMAAELQGPFVDTARHVLLDYLMARVIERKVYQC